MKVRGRFDRLAGSVGVLVGGVIFSVAALIGCGPATNPPPPPAAPKLVIDESVASDFEALALETWDKFLAVFQARQDCFGDVHLHAARDLDSRGAYNPDTATVTVRVPATAVMLKSALVHEWAHHLEFQCQAHPELRPAFLKAQGLPPDTPWRPDSMPANPSTGFWADIPSEQYAEATIALVLGRRRSPTKAWVKPEAVTVLEAWAAAGD